MEKLSLPAEVLLLSIDPADGGLLVRRRRHRRRLRKALKAAGSSWGEALGELETAGLVRRTGPLGRRLELIDRAPGGRRFRELRDLIRKDKLTKPRDVELFVILAWTGVLARRLPRQERRVASSRARRLGSTMAGADAARTMPAIADLGLAGAGGGFGSFDSGGMLDGSGLDGGAGGDGGGGWFGGGDGGGGGDSGGGGDGGGGGN